MLMPSIFGENLLDDFFDFPVHRTFIPQTASMSRSAELMKTDVKETEKGYEVEISLPGYKKENIQAELKDGYLTVSATTSSTSDEKEESTGRYIRRERYQGSCSRTFFVGEEMKQEDIKAKYENGILVLSIPKLEAKKPEPEVKRFISIEG